ncbi:uncharacterized protein [Panulirus ornatus]|uniref:uncharacterized protein isoform X2 n=1 Tax=Panulirus ornatus TaxID=150431 RepID=UPI003A8C18E5
MMELLVKKLSCSALPIDQLNEELDAVLPKEKKRNQLPWVEVVEHLFKRAADSSSETLFENVSKITENNLEKTVQRVLRNSKKDGHIYCASLSNLILHIQYSIEDMALPATAVNKLKVLLLSAVIDMESASVRAGEETAAVSRIFLKLTLLFGHNQECVLDTLLHCKTLLYCSARQPLIFVPLIKRIFTSLKNKTPQSPHLYLKYLLLGKLWLFMTKEEVGKMRTYIINSVSPPKGFVDWAVQSQIPWLKLSEWNSQLILRNMTISNALRTLYGDDMPASQGNDIRKSKEKKVESANEACNYRTKQDVCGKVLQKKYGKDMCGKVCDKGDNIKFKPKQKVLKSSHIKQEEGSYKLVGMKNENTYEPGAEVHEEDQTKVSNRLNSYTINSKEELDKTQDKKMLLDEPDRKTKKMKTHDIREEEKEKMMDTGKIKTLKRKNLEIKKENSSKKYKVIGNENEVKSDQFKVLDRIWKSKNSKNVEARIFSKNETSESVEKQSQGSSGRGELKSNAPRFFDCIVSENSLPLDMVAMKQMEKRKQIPEKSHFSGFRERKHDQAQYRNMCSIVLQSRRKSANSQAGKKSSASHVAAKMSKYSKKKEQRLSLMRHKSAIHKMIRRKNAPFTVTDLKPVNSKSLKIDSEERCEGDGELVENTEVDEGTVNAVSSKGKNGAVVSLAIVNTEVCDRYNEESKLFNESLDCHNEMSDDLHNSKSKLPSELNSRENSTFNLSIGGKDLVNMYNDNEKKKFDNEDVEIIVGKETRELTETLGTSDKNSIPPAVCAENSDSDLEISHMEEANPRHCELYSNKISTLEDHEASGSDDNEACEKTGNGEKELVNKTDATREKLSRDSYGNFSGVSDESNSSGEESDSESDEDVTLGLVNQTSVLHQEVKQPSEAMGRVAKKADDCNESKAFGIEGEGNELETTSETIWEGLDRNSDGNGRGIVVESGGSDNESDVESSDSSDGDGSSDEETETSDQEDEALDGESDDSSDGETETTDEEDETLDFESDETLDFESDESSDGETETRDQEVETAILHEEIMKPTEKIAIVGKETRELTETLGTCNKNSIPPAVCAENSDSDLEIVHVEKASPRHFELYSNKISTLEDHACDIDEASGSDDNEACKKTGNSKKKLINKTDATREELSRDSYGNFSEVRDESNSSGEESDGESDEDVTLDLVNQTSVLHQEVKQPSEAMGRVAKKADDGNESKAFDIEGEGNELERTSATIWEGLDRNSYGNSLIEVESGSNDNELDVESSDSSDGETETRDQEVETAILHEEIMKPTEKIVIVGKETRELTETLGTSNKNSIPPAVCAENSDSDLEIVHVEEANPRHFKLYSNKISTLEDHACEIDEASGSDDDIIPCDEKTKMFTDEETKNYHNKLMEAVLQSKVENILKEEERELKRKITKGEKTKSIDPTDGNHEFIGNSTDKETITNETVDCEDLVSQMINKLYKPSANVKSKKVEKFYDPESDSDSDIEVVLQTIVKDTGRLTSIHGLRERLLSSAVIKDEADDSEDQNKIHGSERQETEVPENPVDCSETFKGQGEKIEVLNAEKFCGTKEQETEVIIREELLGSKERICEKPKNEDQEIQVVEKVANMKPKEIKVDKEQETDVIINEESVGSKECICEKPKNEDQEIQVFEKVVNIKPKEIKVKESEISKNIINYTKEYSKSEDQDMKVFNEMFNHSEVDNNVLLRRGSTHETQGESGNELNVNLRNNDIDLQIASTASCERSFSHDAVSHQSDGKKEDFRFLPNTSSQMQENGDLCFSLKSETDSQVKPSCDLELNKKHLLNDKNCSKSEIENINLLAAKIEVKDEVIKEEGDSIVSVDGNETVMEASFIGKNETTLSHGKLDNHQEFSGCERHTHTDSGAGVNNCESSPSVADVDPPVGKSLSIEVDTPEIYKSKVTATASFKKSEAKDLPGFSKHITDSINKVVGHSKSVVGTMNTELEPVTEEVEKKPTVVGTMNAELESVTEESEGKSTEGADEAYEASSDASEDPAPRTRRRTRSLRRSFNHTVLPEASDSDASPEQRTRRTRKSSDMTGPSHVGPSKKRNQSSCVAVANVVSGASGTLQSSQSSLSVYAVGEREDLKKLSSCSKLGTSSGFASHCESDFSTDSQKIPNASVNMDASRASSLTEDFVNRFHTVSSNSPKTSGSASGALMENVGAERSSDSVFRLQSQNVPEKSLSLPPARRRSMRIFEKIADQQKRQFDDAFGVSNSLSGKALVRKSAKNMETVMLTRSVRCTMSDSETVLNHNLHLNTENGKTTTSSSLSHSSLGSAFLVKEYETCNHEVENVLSINRGCGDSCNTFSFGGDKNSSFENLSSGNLHDNESRDACSLDVWVSGKSGNDNEYLDKGSTLVVNILSSDALQGVEEEQQKLGRKNSRKVCNRENQKSECDYLQKVDEEEKNELSIDIVKSSDHILESKENTENAGNKVKEQKDIIEIETDQNYDRVEEYLDEKEGEELEVLSTSGMEENEAPCCSFSASDASDSEEHRSIMNEKVETFVSQKSLRTPSCHRPRGRSGKREVSVDVKKDDVHTPIPPLKVHCVSEAVLAKEVLISPEVSDEECELVSPGVDNDVNEAESVPLPECLETSPKQKPSPISIPSHSMRKKSGGIRSPQKMIPEEQDETTLLRYKVENVSKSSLTPKVKSAVSLGMQDKVKTKASCTIGTPDKGMLTRKLTKTAVNEVDNVVLPKVDLLKSKYPAWNKACDTDNDFLLADPPRKILLSSRSKSLVEKTAQERLVTKVDMIEQSCKMEDLENTEIIDRATAQSFRSTRGRKHKEGLNSSPVNASQTINSDMIIDIDSSENTSMIFPSVDAGISEESSIHEKPALKLSPLKRKSLEKSFDANFALEEMIINEKVPLKIENVKSLKNEVEPQKDEEKTDQFVETPKKHLSSLGHSMDGTVVGECSSVSSQRLSCPLRRSLRLKEKQRIYRIDSSSLKEIVAEDKPVKVTSPSLARLNESGTRSGTLITSRSPYLTMKASPRKFTPASSLSCGKNGSSLKSSSTRDELPSRSSPKKSECQSRSSSKKDEVPAPLSHKKMESVIGLASSDEESAAGKFIRCASSPMRSSPRLRRSSSNRDESCLRSTASGEESPVRSPFKKEGSLSRLSFSRNKSIKCPSMCKVRSSPTRQDVASPRSSMSDKELPTKSSPSLRTHVHLSSRQESLNGSSCNENISPDNSSTRRIQTPTKPFSKRNESQVRSSPGKTPLSKNESLARSFHEEDELSTGLSISSDIPQMRSSPKHMKFPISSFPVENESQARLSPSKKDSLAEFLSLQSKTSTSLNKDEPPKSSFDISLATKVSSKQKSSSPKPIVRPSLSKNGSPARSLLSKNELHAKSTSSKNHSPTTEPNDEGVADLVGVRCLRHRQVTYSVT